MPAITWASKHSLAHRPRLWLVAALLITVIGLRREVGGDWYNYLDMLNYIQLADWEHAIRRSEPGYAILNIIAAEAGWGIWFPNLVCAAIFTWGLVALSRQQPNAFLAIAAAIYLITLVGMGYTRQSAALGFVMLAINQYLRGATVWAFVNLALASTFHVSSVVIAPMLGLAISRRGIVSFALVCVIGVYFYMQLSGRVEGKLEVYTRHVYAAGGATIRVLLNIMPAAAYLAFRHRFARTDEEMRLLTIFSLTSFALLAGIFFVPSTLILDRIGFYIAPLQIFVLARIPYAFGDRSRASILLTVAVLAYALAIEIGWLTLGKWGSAWIPYRNYVWDWSPPRAREGTRSRY